mgnify:CR=1 FL=1
MSSIEILLIGIGLSMDAFAVSVCKGLSVKKLSIKNILLCGVWFGSGIDAIYWLLSWFYIEWFSGFY